MPDFLDLHRICRPRPAPSKAHAEVRDVLLEAMQQMDLQPYDGQNFLWTYYGEGDHSMANLLGVLPGSDPSLPPMILGAHYDTVPETPGADDNAAAIWVILDAVQGLKPNKLKRSVVVALFDAEEPPYFLGPLMGSNVFHQSQMKQRPHCTFIFDLVGHDVPVAGVEDLVFITGMESHRSFGPIINDTSPDRRIRIVPALNSYIGDLSDHHAFRIHGEPYLFFSCGHWQHYHGPGDTIDKLNMGKMEAVSAYTQKLLAACDDAEFPEGSPDHDTTATDLKFMNEVFEGFLRKFGKYPLRSRGDIDKIVQMLMRRFGL